jgi:hypothetical protein
MIVLIGVTDMLVTNHKWRPQLLMGHRELIDVCDTLRVRWFSLDARGTEYIVVNYIIMSVCSLALANKKV